MSLNKWLIVIIAHRAEDSNTIFALLVLEKKKKPLKSNKSRLLPPQKALDGKNEQDSTDDSTRTLQNKNTLPLKNRDTAWNFPARSERTAPERITVLHREIS